MKIKNIINYTSSFSLIIILASLISCSISNSKTNKDKEYVLESKKHKASKRTYRENLNLLAKDPEINEYYKIDTTGISIFDSPESKKKNSPEFKLYSNEIDLFRQIIRTASKDTLIMIYRNKGKKKFGNSFFGQYQLQKNEVPLSRTNKQPLKGLRIALDPGHIAGDWETAMLEERFINIFDNHNDSLAFFEAELAFVTAKYLEDTLVKLGAKVLITRPKNGYSALDKTYEQWLKADFRNAVKQEVAKEKLSEPKAKKILASKDKELVFEEFFKRIETQERTRKINAFAPDLTLVLHYNIHEIKRKLKRGNIDTTTYDYSMMFVPGAFEKKELSDIESRIELLRLIISDDLAQSIEFSNEIQQSVIQRLKIPSVKDELQLPYLIRSCIRTKYAGVYARNLSLNRFVHSPICYAEPLCQNNILEARFFAIKDTEIAGIKVSKRVKTVALAYLDGILNYVSENY